MTPVAPSWPARAASATGVVVPEQFGAKADGTTDDTVALQAAVDSGKKVELTPGATYVVHSVTVRNGLVVDGRGATIKHKTGATAPIFYYSQTAGSGAPVSNVAIRNLVLNGETPTPTGAGQLQGAVVIYQGRNVVVENCVISNFYDRAIYLADSLNVRVVGNRVINCCQSPAAFNGIDIDSGNFTDDTSFGSFFVAFNRIEGVANGGIGIILQPGGTHRSRCVVIGNVVRDATGFAGIAIESNGYHRDVIVAQNHLLGCGRGIFASDTGTVGTTRPTDPEALRNIVIEGNQIDALTLASGIGIECTFSQAAIANNVIRCTSFAVLGGGDNNTTPQRRSHGQVIANNVVAYAGAVAVNIINVSNCDSCTVQGNHVMQETGAVGGSGIRMVDTNGCVIAANTLVGISRSAVDVTDMRDGVITANTILDPNASNGGYDGIRATAATGKALTIAYNAINDRRATPLMGYGINLGAITAGQLVRTRANTIIGAVTLDVSSASVANATVTASPFDYVNTDGSDQDVIVQGGTVSNIEVSRNGTNYYSTGATQGLFHVGPNEHLRVTYSVAPTVRRVPRPA